MYEENYKEDEENRKILISQGVENDNDYNDSVVRGGEAEATETETTIPKISLPVRLYIRVKYEPFHPPHIHED